MESSGPTTSSAITALWELAGNLARRTKIEDAGSKVRQAREDLILTRITKMKLRKESPAKYCYPIPGAYIMMVNLVEVHFGCYEYDHQCRWNPNEIR